MSWPCLLALNSLTRRSFFFDFFSVLVFFFPPWPPPIATLQSAVSRDGKSIFWELVDCVYTQLWASRLWRNQYCTSALNSLRSSLAGKHHHGSYVRKREKSEHTMNNMQTDGGQWSVYWSLLTWLFSLYAFHHHHTFILFNFSHLASRSSLLCCCELFLLHHPPSIRTIIKHYSC